MVAYGCEEEKGTSRVPAINQASPAGLNTVRDRLNSDLHGSAYNVFMNFHREFRGGGGGVLPRVVVILKRNMRKLRFTLIKLPVLYRRNKIFANKIGLN